MSLIINGTERDTLIIGKSIYKYIGERAPIAAANAQTHNATYRGQGLGPFNETFAGAIKNGTFNNMWVGDSFIVNNNTYEIAGFNYECGPEENILLGNHLIMLTDVLPVQNMNSSDTTEGGFAGSDLFKKYFPKIESQLQTDFGSHLLTFNSYLSTSIDDKGAPNNGQWFNVKACMCNSAMWWGKPTEDSNNANGTKFNLGDETEQLPLMKLHTDAQKGSSEYTWLRDIANSTEFVVAGSDGSENAYDANTSRPCNVQAYFLID